MVNKSNILSKTLSIVTPSCELVSEVVGLGMALDLDHYTAVL
jgi:hypothetical protein